MALTATLTPFLDREDAAKRSFEADPMPPGNGHDTRPSTNQFGWRAAASQGTPDVTPVDRPDVGGTTARASAAFLARCIVLQAIGASALVALWIAGLLQKPFEADNAFLCWAIVGMAVLGIAFVFLRRWKDVQWIATHVVRIGLLGTVIGLIIAFSAAATGDAADADSIKPMIAAVVGGMYVSLYATLLGIAVNLWLKVNLRVLGNDHG